MHAEATIDRNTDTQTIADQCAARPDIAPYARIVGAWVWCEFPHKPGIATREWLKSSGFRWNKQRAVWQHPCGSYRPKMRTGDPRHYYGNAPISAADAYERAERNDDHRAMAALSDELMGFTNAVL